MASIVYRFKSRKVYLYYVTQQGKQIQVTRKVTKHWDGLPHEDVEREAAVYLAGKEKVIDRIERLSLATTDKLAVLWEDYKVNRQNMKGRRAITERREDQIFESYFVPFFVVKHEQKDPRTWHGLIPDFYDYLVSLGRKARTIQKILWTLGRFGDYLVWKRKMNAGFSIITPSSPNTKITPLKTKIAPDQVLKFAAKPIVYSLRFKKHLHPIRVDLLALLGYFAALRPEELYALDKSDLRTGLEARTLAKTYDGFKTIKLGSGLSVIVSKSLQGSEPKPLLKTEESFGIVNIWNADAAKLIAAIVRDFPDGRLFPGSRSTLDRVWRVTSGALGSTVHDLRRASCLYLGRNLRIPMTLLQEHARHAEIDTTMLYIREPRVPETKVTGTQNFDDVG